MLKNRKALGDGLDICGALGDRARSDVHAVLGKDGVSLDAAGEQEIAAKEFERGGCAQKRRNENEPALPADSEAPDRILERDAGKGWEAVRRTGPLSEAMRCGQAVEEIVCRNLQRPVSPYFLEVP